MTINARPTMADSVGIRTTGWLWDIVLVMTFGTIMGLVAQLSIPLPFTPVPLSGQTFGVLLSGALLGSRRGAAAMVVYLLEGASGLPVFALGHAGWPVLLGPTGGYLLACPFAAFSVGRLAELGWDRSFWRAAAAMFLGEVIIYAVALPWLAYFVGAGRVVALGLLPFIVGDTIKLLLAAALLPSGWALLRTLHAGQI